MAGYQKVQSFVKTFSSSIPAQTFITTAPTAGNLLVCICADGSGQVISAPTQNTVGSSAFTLAVTRTAGTAARTSIYYTTVPAGMTTTYTVTGHYAAITSATMFISEWSGTLNPATVNSSGGATVSVNASTGVSGSLTMSSANCLLLAAITDNTGANPATFSTQGGWQQVDIQSNGASFFAAAVACKPSTGSSALSTGAYQSSWGIDSALYAGAIAAFLPDGAGGVVAARRPLFTLMHAGR